MSNELEKLQYGWVACLRCQKTFFKMNYAKYHYENEHIGNSDVATNKNTLQLESVTCLFDFDQFIIFKLGCKS